MIYEQYRRSYNSCPNTIWFNGGEICTSIGTLHNIHVLQHVARSYSTGMWIDHTQRTADWYSRINDMNSTNARAILTQTPYDFNGGEICTSIGTLHNMQCETQHVQLILNERRFNTQGPMNGKCRRLINSGPNTIRFLWRRELIQRRHSAQHTCASTCGSRLTHERVVPSHECQSRYLSSTEPTCILLSCGLI
jgi:hypothetical protein